MGLKHSRCSLKPRGVFPTLLMSAWDSIAVYSHVARIASGSAHCVLQRWGEGLVRTYYYYVSNLVRGSCRAYVQAGVRGSLARGF